MTDRINALTVVLEENVREDDQHLQVLQDAISAFRGVVGVIPHLAEPMSDEIARQRLRGDIGPKIMDIIYGPQT